MQRVDTSAGTGRLDVRRTRRVSVDPRHNALPLGAHGRVTHTVETEDEEAL